MRGRTLCACICIAAALLSGCGAKGKQAKTEYTSDGKRMIVFTMRTEEGSMRNENMIHGIEQAAKSAPSNVSLTYKKLPKPDETTELMQFRSGVYADFNWNTQSDIGWMTETGLIQPVDWIRDLACFATMPASVLEKVTYKGHISAIPYDCVMTMAYVNKRALRGLGWGDGEIAALPERVARGDFTLQDVATLCREALDKKLVKQGFLMNGVEWNTLFALSNAFGASSYDRAAEKLVLAEKPWMDYFRWWYGAINEQRVVPRGLPGMSGEAIVTMLLGGEAMVYIGYDGYRNMRLEAASAGKGEDFESWFADTYVLTLPPSGIKGRAAATQMKVFVVLVSSKTDAEKIGYLKQILEHAYAPEIQARTSLANLSIPVTRNVLEVAEVGDIAYIAEVAKYVDVAEAWASHPYYHQYLIHHKKVIEQMIVESATSEKVFAKLKEELTYNVDAKEIVFRTD